MAKRALVAGGAGFIGSHLVDLLLSKGYEVVVVDVLVTGRETNLSAALAKGVQLEKADIRDRSALDRLLRQHGHFDEIYNLASPASPVDFARIPMFILETGSIGHRNLLDLAREAGSRVLFASSSEVYGDAEVHPQVETYFGNVNTVGHRSCYDEAKRYGESLSVAFTKEFGVETRMARIFNTYGPRMRPNDGRIIPNFFIQALQKQSLTVYGDGSQTRSFCYCSDQAAGLFALMQSNEARPVNVGNPIERTVMEIAQAVNALTGNTAPLRYLPLPENDPKVRRPDITRAKVSTGWEPKVDLETGLKACLEYFRAELAASPGGIHAPTL
ncbi:MAG: NAD-dependent epimerase/dehydratase family protein [Bdellovibrionota bacterium]